MWGWGWLQGRLVASEQGFLLGCQFCVPATHGSLSKAVHGCAWLCMAVQLLSIPVAGLLSGEGLLEDPELSTFFPP